MSCVEGGVCHLPALSSPLPTENRRMNSLKNPLSESFRPTRPNTPMTTGHGEVNICDTCDLICMSLSTRWDAMIS
ncbi:hypothetical protein X798_05191 [Onchocerca flexuosa]|uniref:Uncharacterized protein n=1 Tax=Onchocerca flexuosa TaxID=387005 RepID=A0A238BSF5_9BILA|nr:hypothetical protein X798_05191 [Onchocerca flexuosa]